jgi:hypothetical protein
MIYLIFSLITIGIIIYLVFIKTKLTTIHEIGHAKKAISIYPNANPIIFIYGRHNKLIKNSNSIRIYEIIKPVGIKGYGFTFIKGNYTKLKEKDIKSIAINAYFNMARQLLLATNLIFLPSLITSLLYTKSNINYQGLIILYYLFVILCLSLLLPLISFYLLKPETERFNDRKIFKYPLRFRDKMKNIMNKKSFLLNPNSNLTDKEIEDRFLLYEYAEMIIKNL